jgi:hypothetical protein
METTMIEESDGNNKDDELPGQVSGREMLVKIIDLASTDGLSDEALQEMVEALEKIAGEYKQKEA